MAGKGIKIARRTLRQKTLKANLRIGNIFDKLPYKDDFFDAVVSVQVLQHGKEMDIKKAIREIKRVLRPAGLIFITLSGRCSKGKVRPFLVKTAKKIAPRTYRPTQGKEVGLIHYIFNKRQIKKHFRSFKILKLWRDEKDYYCFMGQNKKNIIKAIIFDYGKVIGNDSSKKIYRKISKEFNIDTKKVKCAFFKFIFQIEKNQIPENVFWKKLAKKLNINNYRRLKKVWIEEYQKHAKVNKKLLNVIKVLKEHYILCLLSNNASFYRKDSIEKILKKHFHYIIYSYNVKMRKPENRIYFYTIKKLKKKYEECLLIDDNKTALLNPKKLGMETIRFKSFPQIKKDLSDRLKKTRSGVY